MFLWVVFIVNTVLYVITIRTVKTSVSVLGGSGIGSAALRRLGLYPLLLVVAYSFATVNRLQNWIAPGYPLFWLYIVCIRFDIFVFSILTSGAQLHVMFSALNGLFNAIAYTTAPQIRAAVRLETARLLSRCRCCFRAAAALTSSEPSAGEHLTAEERDVMAAVAAAAGPSEEPSPGDMTASGTELGHWRRLPSSPLSTGMIVTPTTPIARLPRPAVKLKSVGSMMSVDSQRSTDDAV
jgi:hypothetical protein